MLYIEHTHTHPHTHTHISVYLRIYLSFISMNIYLILLSKLVKMRERAHTHMCAYIAHFLCASWVSKIDIQALGLIYSLCWYWIWVENWMSWYFHFNITKIILSKVFTVICLSFSCLCCHLRINFIVSLNSSEKVGSEKHWPVLRILKPVDMPTLLKQWILWDNSLPKARGWAFNRGAYEAFDLFSSTSTEERLFEKLSELDVLLTL